MRELCTRHGALLIFDEVMTGFRVGARGAQGLYGITPDLTTLGKVIGGGMPLGAFGGRRDIMQSIAPLGPVYQAGTLSGNPVAVAAGLATLKLVQAPGFYDKLDSDHAHAVRALDSGGASSSGIPFSARSIGGMFGMYFRETPPQSTAKSCSATRDVQPFLPRDAARRRIPRAVGVRGGLRFVCARQCRDRKDGYGGGARLRRRSQT